MPYSLGKEDTAIKIPAVRPICHSSRFLFVLFRGGLYYSKKSRVSQLAAF
jgi:hypothetical protein